MTGAGSTMRLALFTPLSPRRTGLAEHIEGLLPYLARELDITAVTDGSYRPSHSLFHGRDALRHISYAAFQAQADAFDLVAYQLGNEGRTHAYMYEALHRYPGVVLLHDLTLHHGMLGATLGRGDTQAYIDELRYAHGLEGERRGYGVMDEGEETAIEQYPLVERVLDSSLAVVGFNSYICRTVQSIRPGLPTAYIPLQVGPPDGFPTDFDRRAFRRELGLAERPVIATLGLYNPNNRLHIALEAFRQLLGQHPAAIYLLVGAPPGKGALEAHIQTLGLGQHVRFTGWVSAIEFQQYLTVPDVAVQLRYPHAGGTCYNPLRLLAEGVPTIISAIEPMADVPDDAVVRVPPDTPSEGEELFRAMDALLNDRARAVRLAERGRAWATQELDPAAVSARLAAFIRQVAAAQPGLQERLRRIWAPRAARLGTEGLLARAAAGALAGLGLTGEAPEALRTIAQVITDLSGGPDARPPETMEPLL